MSIVKGGLNETQVDARVEAVVPTLSAGIIPRCYSITVADDQVGSISLGADAFAGVLNIVSNITATNWAYGEVAFRAASSGVNCALISTATNVEVTTGVLSAGAGTDAKVTVSPHTDQKIYISNRLGGSRTFLVQLSFAGTGTPTS